MADAVLLHVCTTCQGGETLLPGEVAMGRRLHDAVAAVVAEGPADAPGAGQAPAVELRETSCLANCARGCSAVLSRPGLWTYLLGGLTPAVAADLAAYARTYGESRTGTVMPSRRAASLRDVVMGRVPPADAVGDRDGTADGAAGRSPAPVGGPARTEGPASTEGSALAGSPALAESPALAGRAA